MGKLVDTLHRAGRASGPSIGFMGRAAGATKPKAAAIIVDVPAKGEAIAEAVKAGADIVLISPDESNIAAKEASISWGFDLRTNDTITITGLRTLQEMGADFVLFGQTVPMRALGEHIEHLERVLTVAPPKDDPLLITFRALNLLDVDAVVLDLHLHARDLAEMTVERFTQLRMLFETLRFPTIVTIQEAPTKEDIFTLARLGAQGIWLAQAKPESITTLREALESVPREKDPSTPAVGGLGGGSAPGAR